PKWRPLAKTRAKSAWFTPGGAVAQLGERLVRNEEVRGSTPLGSTSVAACVLLGFLQRVVPTQTPKKSICHNAGTAGTDMATIRRRKSRWQVQVRRRGHRLSRTFRLRADAELWARQLEAELDRGGLPTDSRRFRSQTLADLLRRYEAEIVPRKRS